MNVKRVVPLQDYQEEIEDDEEENSEEEEDLDAFNTFLDDLVESGDSEVFAWCYEQCEVYGLSKYSPTVGSLIFSGDSVTCLAWFLDAAGAEHTNLSTLMVDAAAADAVITAFNSVAEANSILGAYVYATVSTDTRHERAQGLLSELEVLEANLSPLTARLAEWVASLGADALAKLSDQAREHLGPLRRLQARAEHQMSEAEEQQGPATFQGFLADASLVAGQ